MRLIQRLQPPRPCAASRVLSAAQTLALCLSAVCVMMATYSSLEHSQRAAALHRSSLRRAGFEPTTVAVQHSAVDSSGSNSSNSSSSGGDSGLGSDTHAGSEDSGEVGLNSAPKAAEADSAALAVCLVTKVEADDPQWRDGVAQDLVEVRHPAPNGPNFLLSTCGGNAVTRSWWFSVPVQLHGTGKALMACSTLSSVCEDACLALNLPFTKRCSG